MEARAEVEENNYSGRGVFYDSMDAVLDCGDESYGAEDMGSV